MFLKIFPAPAHIENPEHPLIQNPLHTTTNFSLQCNATGNARVISWEKDGGSIPDVFQVTNQIIPTHPNITKFGQKETLISMLQWNISELNSTCKTVERHNGKYKCTPNATTGGMESSDEKILTVDVQCMYSKVLTHLRKLLLFYLTGLKVRKVVT